MSYAVVVTSDPDDENLYYAHVPTLEISTYGISVDDAFAMAEEAISLRVELALRDGDDLPVEGAPAHMREIAVARN